MRPFHLNQTIASSAPADPDDTVSTKRALHTLDLYKFRDHENTRQTSPYPNTEMFEGLKILQQRNHQRIDGRMEPGGPTARMLQAELDAKSGATNTYPPFALGRTIGDRGRNARADIVRARPILEQIGGPMRDSGEPDEHDINNRIRSIQHLLNLPPSGTIAPGDITHRTVAKATGSVAGISEPDTSSLASVAEPNRDTAEYVDRDTGRTGESGDGLQRMRDMMDHQPPYQPHKSRPPEQKGPPEQKIDWSEIPAATISYTGSKSFVTTGPIKIRLSSIGGLGANGADYEVSWRPLDADGTPQTFVYSPDQKRLTYPDGGHFFTPGKRDDEPEPPTGPGWDQVPLWRVTVHYKPQPEKHGVAERPQLNVYLQQKDEMATKTKE